MNTMDANDEKINGAIQYSAKLAEEEHYNAEKVWLFFTHQLVWLTDSATCKIGD